MSINEKARDIFDSVKEPAIEMTCELFLEGVIGTVVPGVTGAILSYKQRRQEKMFERFILETKEKIQLLEERLRNLSQEQYRLFKEKYFGFISDYVMQEVQEEKVKYIVNGLINAAAIPDVAEDFILTYYDTLSELRIRDIGILKFYCDMNNLILYGKNYSDILEELKIDYEQYNAIREKLLRLGLLTTKREK